VIEFALDLGGEQAQRDDGGVAATKFVARLIPGKVVQHRLPHREFVGIRVEE
jgi:hypothetical protein